VRVRSEVTVPQPRLCTKPVQQACLQWQYSLPKQGKSG